MDCVDADLVTPRAGTSVAIDRAKALPKVAAFAFGKISTCHVVTVAIVENVLVF